MSRTSGILIRFLPALCLTVIAVVATGFSPQLTATLYLAGVTPWLVAIDLRERRLPNPLVVPAIAVGFAACAGEWLVSARPPVVPVFAGLGYGLFLLLLHLVGGVGMGDVKLGVALGLASWNLTVVVLSPVVAFMVGGLVAVGMLIAGRKGTRMAFGPYLLGGYWVAVALVAVPRLV